MKKLTCRRCGFQWLPRTGKPVKCPNCQSRKWNKRKRPKAHKFAVGSKPRKEFDALCILYNWSCLACGRRQHCFSVDHVDPYGADEISNLRPLCIACNSGKRNKHIDYRNDPHPNCLIPYKRPESVNYNPQRYTGPDATEAILVV